MSTDVAGKEDGIVLLEDKLQELSAYSTKTINELSAEIINGINNLQIKVDQIKVIKA